MGDPWTKFKPAATAYVGGVALDGPEAGSSPMRQNGETGSYSLKKVKVELFKAKAERSC